MKFPGLKHLAVKWAREHEDGAPAIYLALEHSYASPADLETALASEARAGVREAVEVVLPYFQGTIVHVNSEVREFAA